MKPEILAPGAFVAAAMSVDADPRVTSHLDRRAIDRLLDPMAYTGLCADMARQSAARARAMVTRLSRTE